MKSHLTNVFYGVTNLKEFTAGLQHSINHLNVGDRCGVYAGDNIFTYARNLSFLDDSELIHAFSKHAKTNVEQSMLWRTAIVLWGVRNGLHLKGDFIESACYKGTTVRIVCDAINFSQYKDRYYYLYDLFYHDDTMPHHDLPEHSEDLYKKTVQRFSDCPNVKVIQGRVPEIMAEMAPQKIAFMHLDMNDAQSEIGALEKLFDRMVPGALLVLDDYGWLAYRTQKLTEDPWFAQRGHHVIELPTGQGLVIKHM